MIVITRHPALRELLIERIPDAGADARAGLTRRLFVSGLIAAPAVITPARMLCRPWYSPPLINVKWYGAVGDGVTDDTDALRDAMHAALTVGGTLFYPPGEL